MTIPVFRHKDGGKPNMPYRTSMSPRNKRARSMLSFRNFGNVFMSVSLLLSSTAAQIIGPTLCPNTEEREGYSDLDTLRSDIARTSNETSQADGGKFVLCPDSVFSFTITPSDDDLFVDDDIITPPTVDTEPIVIDANSTQIICGDGGDSSNNCIFLEGAFQIVIVGEPTGVVVTGITFIEAKNASIVYSGNGGDLTFNDCIWRENSGNGVILAVLPEETQIPTMLPSESIDQPSMSIQPTSSGSTSGSPSESLAPTAPSISLTPSLSLAPSVSQNPTAPSVSLNPSMSIQPSSSGSTSASPSESQVPTAPSVSLKPSLLFSPSESQNPTAPSVSLNPSTSTQPSSSGSTSQSPTAPSVSINPSASIQPSSSSSTSSSPSESQVPTAPSVSLTPSLSFSPSESQNPTAPSVSVSPSLSMQPSLIPSSSLRPTSIEKAECPDIPPEGCSICGPGKCVTEPDGLIDFPGSPPIPCDVLEDAGRNGEINLEQCGLLSALVDEPCACDTSPEARLRMLSTSLHANQPPMVHDSSAFTSQATNRLSRIKSLINAPRHRNEEVLYLEEIRAVAEQSKDFRRQLNPRYLQNNEPFKLTLDNCEFTRNDIVTAAVFILGGDLSITSCEFIENSAVGSIVSVFEGELAMQDTNFVGNDFQVFPAPVFLDTAASLSETGENCGDNGSECEGVFLQTGGDCSDPDTCEGNCSKFTSTTCVSGFCYNEWNELVKAVENAAELNEEKEFIICENSVLAVEDQMVISQSNTRISCGENGSRLNNCTIFGGTSQIEIIESTTDISLAGITFLASTIVALKASGNIESSLILLDCEFNGHTGRSTIEIYNGGIEGDEEQLEKIPDPPGAGMTIIAVNCTFVDNEVYVSPVSNFKGIAAFDLTLFIGNRGEAGAIFVREGQISVSNSCFLSSVSSGLPGMIFIDEDSQSLQNAANFGSQNTAIDEPSCVEMFTETDGSCVEDPEECSGDCAPFSSKECGLLPPSPAPSEVPSEVPSFVPSQVPSWKPSQTPSYSPSLSVLPSSAGCINSWNQLSAAIAAVDDSGEDFIICPNTIMNVDFFPDPDVTPIVISANNVTVQCGATGTKANNCVVFGGNRHFQIDGDSRDIKFFGIRFVGALITSIDALGTSAANAQFVDCDWTEGVGPQQILIDGGEDFEDPSTLVSMTVELTNCLFKENSNTDSIVKNIGGALILNTTLLEENEAEEGIILVSGNGVISLSGNCFVSNVVEADQAIVVIGQDSTVILAENNFGRGNSVGETNSCVGILDEGQEICDNFDATECVPYDLSPTGSPTEIPSFLPSQLPTVAPINGTQGPSNGPEPTPTPTGSEPSDPPTGIGSPSPTFGCFSRWDQLSLAILRACAMGAGGVFILCPDTVFDVDEYPDPLVTPITVHSSDITVQCGSNGARSNNCVISGGVTQFKLRNTIIGVEFKGLIFEKSRGVSIFAGATGDSMAFFVDCEWRENEGSSAISMVELNRNEKAMMVGLRRSKFIENLVIDAVLLNDGGSLVVEESIFLDNRASEGAIYVIKGGKVSVMNSCYVRNEGGAVTLNDSSLERDEGNFGFSNGMCNGILDEDDMNSVMCGKACTVFEEDECAVMEFDPEDIPTDSPTVTFQPNCVPTTSPYPSLSPADNPSPTSNPTQDPTEEPSAEPMEGPTPEPTEEPSDPPTRKDPTEPPTTVGSPAPSFGCFSEWDRLSLAISAACAEDRGGVFVLCPGSKFEVDKFSSLFTPIIIYASDVTVQCGDDGARSNNCVISGGVAQFKMRSVIVGIEFKGLTFEESRGMSVLAGATMDSMASFIDCKWRNNVGSSVVSMIDSDNDGPGMMLAFRNCNFTDNRVTEAAVVNFGGKLFVEDSVFLRNEGDRGAILLGSGGGITLLDSCFVQNLGGAVSLDESTLIRDEGNFGFANEKCNGVLDLDDSHAVLCGDACTEFDESQCAVMNFDIDEIPTESPTITPPNCVPTGTPTQPPTFTIQPTKDTTNKPTPTGPSIPTEEPTEMPSDTPTERPTTKPSRIEPTAQPSNRPSKLTPTNEPTNTPSGIEPTPSPSNVPMTPDPTLLPTNLRSSPPTKTMEPSSSPSTYRPSNGGDPTPEPQTSGPSPSPSRLRTSRPSASLRPSSKPSRQMDTTSSPTLSEHPTPFDTDMSFSLDYNFFYKFH